LESAIVSNENCLEKDAILMPMVIANNRLPAIPGAKLHTIDVKEIHVVATAPVGPFRPFALASSVPKFMPIRVDCNPPLAPLFNPNALDTEFVSKEKHDSNVVIFERTVSVNSRV
jgi:hypothetical protein